MLGKLFYKCQLGALVYGVVEMFYNILADFLSSCIITCWKKGAEDSNYNWKSIFPFISFSFCFTYPAALLFGIHI